MSYHKKRYEFRASYLGEGHSQNAVEVARHQDREVQQREEESSDGSRGDLLECYRFLGLGHGGVGHFSTQQLVAGQIISSPSVSVGVGVRIGKVFGYSLLTQPQRHRVMINF